LNALRLLFFVPIAMKPFLRQTLDRQLLRLHELDALLSAAFAP
jgi:hypothetical protein